MKRVVLIRQLHQIGKQTFQIAWTDDRVDLFSLAHLQSNCPCKACFGHEVAVDAEVQAKKIKNVGRYALQIEFTSGCSRGIFPFQLLRNLAIGES